MGRGEKQQRPSPARGEAEGTEFTGSLTQQAQQPNSKKSKLPFCGGRRGGPERLPKECQTLEPVRGEGLLRTAVTFPAESNGMKTAAMNGVTERASPRQFSIR